MSNLQFGRVTGKNFVKSALRFTKESNLVMLIILFAVLHSNLGEYCPSRRNYWNEFNLVLMAVVNPVQCRIIHFTFQCNCSKYARQQATVDVAALQPPVE